MEWNINTHVTYVEIKIAVVETVKQVTLIGCIYSDHYSYEYKKNLIKVVDLHKVTWLR